MDGWSCSAAHRGGITVAIIAAVLAIRQWQRPSALSGMPEKSIAVLPFENLSANQENAFFTDGVQGEILTDLAKVADLKVISQTSVMQYRNTQKRNLREIAQALRVSHILEGSVQRAANRVRVNAQLIDARNDTHMWAETFDRELADLFAIQSEIAQAIANQLRAKLSPREEAVMHEKPTSDMVAYRSLPAGSGDLAKYVHFFRQRRSRETAGGNPSAGRRRSARSQFCSALCGWCARTCICTGSCPTQWPDMSSRRAMHWKRPHGCNPILAMFI